MKRAFGLLLAISLLISPDSASTPQESHLNRLWKQGYGFNNPNPERIRSCQKPFNFGESD
jgi:hypothetical protein